MKPAYARAVRGQKKKSFATPEQVTALIHEVCTVGGFELLQVTLRRKKLGTFVWRKS